MKRLSIITALMLLIAVVTIWAAPGDKVLFVSQPKFSAYSANREAIPFTKKALSTYTSSSGLSSQSIYRRVLEIKNAAGKVVYYVQAGGKVVIGTPIQLQVSSVWPANGATGLYNMYSSGHSSKGLTGSYVMYNKGAQVAYSSQQAIGGKRLSLSYLDTKAYFSNFSAASSTTYTIRVFRNKIPQTDGEWTSSCGARMTDVSGVCTSTFSTR